MKKLFIVLCDIMAVAAVVAVVSLAAWIFTAPFGSPAAGTAKTVCIVAAIVAVVAVVASFIVWKHGGDPGGDDPPEEGRE